MAKDEKTEEQAEKPKSKMMLIIIIAVLVVLLLGGGIAAALLMGGNETADLDETTAPQMPAIYFDFKPPFIVNYQVSGRPRFVQVSMAVMTRNGAVVNAMQQHMPLIRNNLLMVFSAQDFDMLRTPEGKEALRQLVLEELQRILLEQMGEPGVEQVLFTNFVMQ